MIERLLIAFAVLAAIGALGTVVRVLFSARSSRLTANAVLSGSQTNGARLLLFSSTWCAECAVQRRIVEESRASWAQTVDVSYHDTVTESALARRFGIMTVPALVVARADGAIVGVKQGLVDGDRLRSLIAAAA